tara:strand:+ start:2044 stop:2610 length:567 start_codon:yes stop_codon:yes gene_type:complete
MKNSILLDSLCNYYEDEGRFGKLMEVLKEENQISLRIIDWFVTNYSKKNNIYYSIFEDPEKGKTFSEGNGENLLKQFNTYHSYKAQLKSFSKKRFDPFCRRDRIKFKTIETTVGQLNFFKWAIDNLIIDYIKEYYDKIEMDMNNSYNDIKVKKKEKKDKTERKKRQELSKSASRGLNTNKMKVVLDFN